ncbi:ABC transporter ATP-binding protein [Micromonosporaceae bacterium Da 78-11]
MRHGAGLDARSRGRRLVLRSMRPGRRAGLALLVSVLAATVLPVLAPRFTSRFVDDAIAGAAIGHLAVIAFGYLSVAVAALGARAVTGWLASRLAWDGTNRLRERVAEHALHLGMDFHGRHTPGEMIERVDGDVVAVADFAVAFLLDVVVSVLLLLGVLVGVFVVDVRIGGVLATYCLVVFLAMVYGQRLTLAAGIRARAAEAALYGRIEESLAGAEDIRANGAGAHVVGDFHRSSAAWYRAEYGAARIGTAVLSASSVAFAGGTAVVLAVAVWLVDSGALTVGTTVLLFQYTLLVRAPFEQLIEQMRQYQGALSGVARLADLLDEPRTPAPPARPLPMPSAGALPVHLDRVTLRYDALGAPALSDVELTLAPGESLGVVGRTGSGKTTLARLVLRLHDPTAGAVRIGGLDLREADPTGLRARVGMVTQDVQLFAADIRDNLTLFRSTAEDERLLEVLREVGLGAWFAEQPDGLDTMLTGLSAGEAQLLAFARVLLTDPGVVVLDEPSSRLDLATERQVQRCVDRLLHGRTGIVIAHRLSSLARMDKIAVLDGGRVVEYGARTDLVADPDSRYRRMLDLAGAGR